MCYVQLLYFTYGTRDLLEKKCKDLPQKVRLWLDKEEVELRDLEAITVLNIPCWGAGVRPWHMGAGGQLAQPQRCDDGLLEVIGLYSSFHVAQLQIGMSEPVRLGQAKEVKVGAFIVMVTLQKQFQLAWVCFLVIEILYAVWCMLNQTKDLHVSVQQFVLLKNKN